MDQIVQRLKDYRVSILDQLERVEAALVVLEGRPSVDPMSPTAATKKRKKRRKLTAEERQAISVRMKHSWARRKQAQEKSSS